MTDRPDESVEGIRRRVWALLEEKPKTLAMLIFELGLAGATKTTVHNRVDRALQHFKMMGTLVYDGGRRSWGRVQRPSQMGEARP